MTRLNIAKNLHCRHTKVCSHFFLFNFPKRVLMCFTHRMLITINVCCLGCGVVVVIYYMYNVTPAAESDRLLRISVYLHLNNGVLSFTGSSYSRIPDSGCCYIRLYFIVIRLFFSFCHCFPSFCVCVWFPQRKKRVVIVWACLLQK